MEANTESESGKRLVDMVRSYVSMTDQMADLIGKAFATSEEDQRVVREVKESGVKVIDVVSSYTKAVEGGLNALNMAFGVVR